MESFSPFRCPNIHKPESTRVLFLATRYKKPSLKRNETKENSRKNTVVHEDKDWYLRNYLKSLCNRPDLLSSLQFCIELRDFKYLVIASERKTTAILHLTTLLKSKLSFQRDLLSLSFTLLRLDEVKYLLGKGSLISESLAQISTKRCQITTLSIFPLCG